MSRCFSLRVYGWGQCQKSLYLSHRTIYSLFIVGLSCCLKFESHCCACQKSQNSKEDVGQYRLDEFCWDLVWFILPIFSNLPCLVLGQWKGRYPSKSSKFNKKVWPGRDFSETDVAAIGAGPGNFKTITNSEKWYFAVHFIRFHAYDVGWVISTIILFITAFLNPLPSIFVSEMDILPSVVRAALFLVGKTATKGSMSKMSYISY